MSRRWQSDDDDDFDDDDRPDDSELEDWEAPDEVDDDEETATVICSACGAEAYEFAEHCPHCGELLTRDTRVWSGRSWLWIALGLAGILAVIYVMLCEHGVIQFFNQR